ncbi:MAG: DUF433 domain-containing protein [Chloroflexi bacterium]|nr:DUF433 domain-containing protein [Chloroflexota bacterium]
MAAMTHPYVEETPGVCGGYPVIRGTRTPVRVVVEIFEQTESIDATLEYFDWLEQEQVRGALDYYREYPERVEEDRRTEHEARLALMARSQARRERPRTGA